jgi:DNA-binding NarL/FixJ family response regulator
VIKTLLVDDESLVRAGLRFILESAPDVEIVGEAEDGGRAMAEIRRARPDVVLMDIRMPRSDGLAATEARTPARGPTRRHRAHHVTEVGLGHSNAEIAARLHMSEATVKSHVSHLFDKLAVTNRVQVAIAAYRAGLVD